MNTENNSTDAAAPPSTTPRWGLDALFASPNVGHVIFLFGAALCVCGMVLLMTGAVMIHKATKRRSSGNTSHRTGNDVSKVKVDCDWTWNSQENSSGNSLEQARAKPKDADFSESEDGTLLSNHVSQREPVTHVSQREPVTHVSQREPVTHASQSMQREPVIHASQSIQREPVTTSSTLVSRPEVPLSHTVAPPVSQCMTVEYASSPILDQEMIAMYDVKYNRNSWTDVPPPDVGHVILPPPPAAAPPPQPQYPAPHLVGAQGYGEAGYAQSQQFFPCVSENLSYAAQSPYASRSGTLLGSTQL